MCAQDDQTCNYLVVAWFALFVLGMTWQTAAAYHAKRRREGYEQIA